MENFDLYDFNKNKTGEVLERGIKVPENRYRLVVHIVVFNSKGEMLIQQRVETKNDFPNMWDLSVGGSVIAGEKSCQGAERELFEEVRIRHDFNGVTPNFTINFECGFDDFYVIKKDMSLSDLTLQKEEVKAVKWANKEEIFQMQKENKFIPHKKEVIELLFSCIDKPYGSF